MIEFHDVSVCYEPNKRHPVRSLDGLSLQIERGDWVFLVGPSGAGKSSLLKLIYAGTSVQSGRVVVDGQDITQIARNEIPALRRKIGIVFQDFQLLNEKTAWENVAFTLRVIGAPQSLIVREVPRALETVGLTHRAEAFPHELSGGEQQRIAVARAIVNDPKILLADEPTGNLDPQTAREVGELLTKINFERGTTIVMATHDRSFVNELQRRVVRLKTGKIVSDENPGSYGAADEGAEETAPFKTQTPHLPAPRVEKARPETPRLIDPRLEVPPFEPAPAPTQPISPPAAPVEPSIQEKESETEKTPAFSGKWEQISATPSEIGPTNAEIAEKPPEPPREFLLTPQVSVEIPQQPVQIPQTAVTAQKPAAMPDVSPAPPPVPPAPKPAPAPQKLPDVPVISTPVISTPVISTPVISTPPAPRDATPNTFSENTPLEDFPTPRPMARRIAPSNAPAPPPPSGHVLDPNAQADDPDAPVGSPENPIVQYE